MANLKEMSFDAERKVYSYDIVDSTGVNVGRAQLRLVPSRSAEMPAGFESHVFYQIDEPVRRKGYATDALRHLLGFAKVHGLDSVVATVNADNIASIKVIQKCGGQLVSEGRTANDIKVQKYSLPV